MKVLVTGAGGYLGRHVLRGLRARGHDAIVLGRAPVVGHEDLPLLHCDLLAADGPGPALESAGATHLLHLAWVTEYQAYWSSPLNFRWVNASLRLVEAFCRAGGSHVVVAGSCAEYDWSHGYLREASTPLEPATTYGTAKDATRRLLTALCALHRASLAWGHVFFPFGPGEAPQRMVPKLIEVFRGRAPAFGVNAGAWRGMLYVPDAAQAFVALLEQGAAGRFNICSGQPVQLAHVVEVLAEACGADPRSVLDLPGDRPQDPPMLVGENRRLLGTGWRQAWTLERGLADMVRQREQRQARSESTEQEKKA